MCVEKYVGGNRCGMFDASVRKVFATEWEV
jgi:hypothetical protein